MSASDHRRQAAGQGTVPVAIVTVSDTRTPATDESGQLIRHLVETAGHRVVGYRLVKDEPEQVRQALEELAGSEARLIIFNGGTGISQRDRTYDVISQAAGKAAPWLRRVLSPVELPGGRRSRHVEPGNRGRLPGQGRVQHAWLPERRPPGPGKADFARNPAPGLGTRALTGQQIGAQRVATGTKMTTAMGANTAISVRPMSRRATKRASCK